VGRVRVLGLGFCVRVRVSVTSGVSYLNEKGRLSMDCRYSSSLRHFTTSLLMIMCLN